MCKPKIKDRSRLKKMHHMNMFFMMAWRVMFESDSLWVKVLRGKYIKSNKRVP